MGVYTPNLSLYKPDPDEFVDPAVQLSRNWDILDPALKQLLEYDFTASTNPNVSTADNLDILRHRFFKWSSNSVISYFRSTGQWVQDNSAFVTPWIKAGSLLVWAVEHPDFPIGYRLIKKPGGTTEVEWCGALWNLGNTMTINGNETGVMPLPAATIPVVTKYFPVWCGNTSSNYCIARLGFFTGSNDLQFKRYGQDPSVGSGELRVEFTGCKYNLEVTAT
ncbi:hypothetical protein [Streptomyces sp. NPDC048720]|uniref:hypothetical protein n=1 Tax=Streptomyces sp. NPDC048720 TaxID=3365588 RepID=UPI0037186B16